MTADTTVTDFNNAQARATLVPQIVQILSEYGLSLPAHDSVTGLIAAGTVTALLNSVKGNPANDVNNRRANHAAALLSILQQCALST
jgi:hypothetical protein